MEKKVKVKEAPEKFFRTLVGVWIKVYGELIPQVDGQVATPSFVGAEPKHMKSLIKDLRLRAEKKNVEWTEEEAKKRWELFLKKSFEDKFISQNFMLRIISNNRTKIFNNQITPKQNGYTKIKKESGEIYDQL